MSGHSSEKRAFAIAYSFPPDGGSGAIRNVKLLRHLPACGWRLSVLTVRSGDQQADEDADQRLGDEADVIRTGCFYTHRFLVGLKNLVTLRWLRQKSGSREQAPTGSNAVVAEPPLQLQGSSLKAFIENAFAVPDKYVGWLPFAVWNGARSMLKERADVIYAVGKPWTAFFVGYVLKLLFRKPLVIDFMDPWRASTWAPSRGRLLDAVQDRLERFIVRRADFVIANTQELADDFVERLNVLPERIGVLTCGYDPKDVAEVLSEKSQPGGTFTVTHTGSFYKHRTPLHFLQALKQLFDDGRLPEDAIRVNLVGSLRVEDGELASLFADPRIARVVHCESWAPHAEALRFLKRSDVLLLVQPETRLQIPAKLYEYAAVGRPILALADPGGAVDNLLCREGWGSAVRYNDVQLIASELASLYRRYREGQLPDQSAESGVAAFSYSALAERLAHVFVSLTEGRHEVAAVPEGVIS